MLKPFMLKLYTLAIAICCTTLFLTSCSDDEENVLVTDVALSNSELLLIEGQKQLLKAIVVPENASNKNTTWQSSAEDVATVNEYGEVEAKSVGTATITVTTVDGGKTAISKVKVEKPIASVTGINLNKSDLNILVGEKETLIATIIPENATIKTVTWTSSDDAIVTVSEMGIVEAKSVGMATITATTLDGEKTASCAITVDASQFTVRFEMNGGNAIADVIVDKGKTLIAPSTPTKAGGPVEGLYKGMVDPDSGSFVFDGWYTDEALTNSYNFSLPVTTDLTLYAKWTGNVPEPINLEATAGATIVEKAYKYLNGLKLDVITEYTLVLGSDVAVSANLGEFRNANISLLLIGKGKERVIRRTGAGNLFVLYEGLFTIGNNIKVTGTGIGNFYLFYVMGHSNLVMKEGAKISDVTATGNAGGVHLNDGNATFTMEGGEICNNVIERAAAGYAAGGVCISWGKFYMKGGLISGNSVKTSFNSHCVAGGVYINNWNNMYKTGGVIKDNTAVITAAASGKGRIGQQVFNSANNGNASTWRKVDGNLGVSDDLSTADMSNPLWKAVD